MRIIALCCLKFSKIIKSNYAHIRGAIIEEEFNNISFPNIIMNSIILIEDKRFAEHMGVDFYSINRAIYRYIFKNKIEGASTITQQLVRLITNEREIKISRKFKEIILASLIENEFTKEDILKLYALKYNFNTCTGLHTFIIKAGYNTYDLTNIEIFQILARLKYPSINQSNYIRYLKRVRTIEIVLSKSYLFSKNKNISIEYEKLSGLMESLK